MKPIIFVLCFVLMLSCKKEEIQKAVLIKYELTDDVSPVKVKLSVDGDFHRSEWMFDNRYFNGSNINENKGKSEWIFKDNGIGFGTVKFSGSDKNNGKYVGEVNIPLPKVATKIEFTGLSAKSLSANFPDLNGEYKIEFSLYDPYPSVLKSIIVNLKDREGESITFKQPVLFDIPRFYDNAEHYVFLSISRSNEPNPFFRTNIYLKTMYLSDRINFGKLQINYNEKAMFLEADWKP
ncbi:MAG: hypothetical protein Q8N05_10890 [Bacteroidota bacterium]|nr:hypothetical protein [Bacteroidota bacterium]